MALTEGGAGAQGLAALESQLAQAVEVLRGGGLVAYPTDTLYGLGAHAFLEDAVAAVFSAKERPRHQGLPLLIAEAAQLTDLAAEVPDLAWRLAQAYWPGGLTLVLRSGPGIPAIVTGGQPTVALRVPDHPIPRELVRRLGAPLTGTSANKSGGPPPTTAEQVRKQLQAVVALIIDGGRCPLGQPSTIVDVTSRPPRILRIGAVSPSELRRQFPDQQWEVAPPAGVAP
ncbi:MAG: threonylcarbamoyl-AMP synthase [Dehalococcoidia bacterium]|nr:threonylcarbamoyl-AMP synthase [Dehalococcoidia bacterium]